LVQDSVIINAIGVPAKVIGRRDGIPEPQSGVGLA
jgi:hypothetical protein